MRNTLILAKQIEDNLAQGMEAAAAVVEATVRRARPVVLTAAAAVFAFIPLTTDTFWGPLAYVLIGGIIVGTADHAALPAGALCALVSGQSLEMRFDKEVFEVILLLYNNTQ